MILSIIIDGYYGFKNLGDEAILRAILQDIVTVAPGAKVTVLSHDPSYTNELHSVDAVNRYDSDAIAQVVCQSDMVLIGGGGLFSGHYDVKLPDIFSVGYYYSTALMASMNQKPLYYYGLGLGPFFTDEIYNLVRFTLSLGNVITVRDNHSLFLAQSMGLAKVFLTADPAFNLEVPPQKPRQEVIAISLRRWIDRDVEDRVVQNVAEALEMFLVKHEASKVVFLPFQMLDDYNDDRTIINRVISLLPPALLNRVSVAEIDDPTEMASIIASCSLLIGERLHALIFSALAEIPFVALAYDRKVMTLCKDLDMDEYCIDVHELFGGMALLNKAESACENFENIRVRLRKKVAKIKKRTLMNREHFLAFLSNKDVKNTLEIGDSLGALDMIRDLQIKVHSVQKALQESRTMELVLGDERDALQLELLEIQSSQAWRIASLIARARLMLAPNGSFRERILQMSIHTWRLWRSQGTVMFFSRSMRKVVRWTMRRIHRIFFQPDLSWEQFQENILSNLDNYKGLFVQEPVIDWNVPLYQRPQHIATALGRKGYLVIYKSPGNVDNIDGFREVAQNVWVTTLPIQDVGKAIFSVYSTAYATAEKIVARGLGKDGKFVYEYIDHIDSQISGDQENIQKLVTLKEFAFRDADFIVVSARLLAKEAIQVVGPNKVFYIPNGVDINHYRNPVHENVALPKSFVKFRGQFEVIVGYFGAIAPWLWYEMLEELVDVCPDIGFVFIGPDYYGGVSSLPRGRKNFLYLGPVKYQILPAYARIFDICFIPFAPGEIARTTSPLKLFEYFALQKPVVVTSDMQECVAYEEVFSGDSAETIEKAMRKAIKIKDDLIYKARLSLLAEQNSWDERAKVYEEIFERTDRVE